ncbi:hypothetical protein ABG067_001258 [Albugo candida]
MLVARADVLIRLGKQAEAKGLSDRCSHSMENGDPVNRSEWDLLPLYDPQAFKFAGRAVQHYNLISTRDLDDIHVLCLRSDTQTRYLHAFEESKRDLETAKLLDPHDIDTILAMTRLESFHFRWRTAIVSVKNVLDENPDNVTALLLRGQLYELVDSYTQDQADYMRINDAKNVKLVEEDLLD